MPAAGGPVVASVGQGRVLRDQAIRLGWPRNEPFDGLVVAPREVPFGDATLTVVAPAAPALADLDAQVGGGARQAGRRGARRRVRGPVRVQPLEHRRARRGGRQARCCCAATRAATTCSTGLETAGRLAAGGTLALDILKLPHHGSIRNVEADFFARLPARHYVISANGRDGNPESATLEAIAASRADDDFTIHLTNHDGKDDLAARLDAFVAARDAAGRTYGVAFRDPAALGLRIDLGDPPEE